MISYYPIVKTADAEMRAVDNLEEEVKDKILPIFELTRSRISKKFPDGSIHRRLEKLKDVFGERPFILDLTGDTVSRNREIDSLQENREGYRNWIDFLDLVKITFPNVIPTIQMSDVGVDSSVDYYQRIQTQIKSLMTRFDTIAYRFPVGYGFFKTDLARITEVVPAGRIICVIDAGFIPKNRAPVYSQSAIDIMAQIEKYSFDTIVLSATSFPKNPVTYGTETQGSFFLEETAFFDLVEVAAHREIVYSDYGLIHPIRSKQAGGSGWVPRIELPTEDRLFYYRSRRNKSSEKNYADAYRRVAKRISDLREFDGIRKIVGDCWGINQIQIATDMRPPGLSPSFWISVRMNIHMTLQESLFR